MKIKNQQLIRGELASKNGKEFFVDSPLVGIKIVPKLVYLQVICAEYKILVSRFYSLFGFNLNGLRILYSFACDLSQNNLPN